MYEVDEMKKELSGSKKLEVQGKVYDVLGCSLACEGRSLRACMTLSRGGVVFEATVSLEAFSR